MLDPFWVCTLDIQLFRQRFSHESVKAYATMPIGIVGSKSLALLYWGSRRFSNKGREKTNTCLCCFLPPRSNTLRFTQATVKTTITHNNFRHYRVSFSPFVRQPFSKQLYSVDQRWSSMQGTKQFCVGNDHWKHGRITTSGVRVLLLNAQTHS